MGFLLKPLGVLCLIVGTMALPTPLPVGAVLIAFGTALLVMTSSTARTFVRRVRRSCSPANRLLAGVEGRMGRRLSVALRRTRPVVARVRGPARPLAE